MEEKCSTFSSELETLEHKKDENFIESEVGRGGTNGNKRADLKKNTDVDDSSVREVQRVMSMTSLRGYGSERIMRSASMHPQTLSRDFAMPQGVSFTSTPPIFGKYQPRQVYRNISVGGLDDIGFPIHGRAPTFKEGKEPPQPPGGYLEKSTTFYTEITPEKSMFKIRNILEDMEVDYSEDGEKFKFKCETYPKGSKLPFNIRIFSHTGKYAVEIQRRAGDCMAFARLYDSLMQRFAEAGLCEEAFKSLVNQEVASIPSMIPSMTRAVIPKMKRENDDFEIDEDAIEVESSINPLLQMAKSEFVDVQVNAVSAISELSRGNAVSKWIGKNMETHVKLFEALLCADVQDVYRAAATTVANLAKDKGVCTVLNKSKCVKSLVRLLKSSNAQVVRESSRALKNIGSFLGNEMSVSTEEIYNLVKSKDSRTRKHGEALQESVQFATAN